jgi:hypothetical protein
MPLQKWMYNNPQHTSRYYCNYCFRNWNTCSKGGIPPFPLPHLIMNEYPYHQRWILNFDGCCHYWSNSHRYGATSINNNNTCNNDVCLGEDMITHQMSAKQWFHFFANETYGCFYFCFASFLIACAQTTIVHHWQFYLIPSCLFLVINNACP